MEVDFFYKSLSYVEETHKPAYSIHALISKERQTDRRESERDREKERQRERERERGRE